MIDLDLQAFLALEDEALPAHAEARATALDLSLPDACRPGVFENLGLLRRQAALFVAALGEADGPVEAFEP